MLCDVYWESFGNSVKDVGKKLCNLSDILKIDSEWIIETKSELSLWLNTQTTATEPNESLCGKLETLIMLFHIFDNLNAHK